MRIPLVYLAVGLGAVLVLSAVVYWLLKRDQDGRVVMALPWLRRWRVGKLLRSGRRIEDPELARAAHASARLYLRLLRWRFMRWGRAFAGAALVFAVADLIFGAERTALDVVTVVVLSLAVFVSPGYERRFLAALDGTAEANDWDLPKMGRAL